MPRVGKQLQAGDSAAVAESVKIAADIYSPVAGQVKSINHEVEGNPSLLNDEPLSAWIFEVECK